MNNSLTKIRVINEEVKMKREEIREFERQSKLLVENLTHIFSEDYVKSKHKVLYESATYIYK